MRNPVVAADGVCYEREDFEQYIRQRLERGLELRSPTTIAIPLHTKLIPIRRFGEEYFGCDDAASALDHSPSHPHSRAAHLNLSSFDLSSSVDPRAIALLGKQRFIPVDPGSLKTANV